MMLKQTQDSGQPFLESLATAPLAAGKGRREGRLPNGLGEKRQRLQGTPEETHRLQSYLSQQMVAQSAPGPSSRKSVSIACWDHTSLLARVTTQKGSHWSTHGHTHSGQLLLEAHETLFLLEMGCLEVEMAAGPATLRQAYTAIIGDHLPLHQYTVIASLKRRGFVVKRCFARCLPRPSAEGDTDPKPQPAAGRTVSDIGQWDCVPLGNWCVLEVYRPGGRYKKTDPGPPQFRVCVASTHDPFPSPSLLGQLSAIEPSSGETLKWCVVDGSSLTFYTISQGTAPPP